ncbi:MAG: 2,3,4,5-tetrahydropyridine-2,6-dicarboxylate N-succinyltransferase, partial [Bacteroidales bacterium]|nr:2,3,4,5-tetrahydropyridine-2,6-dicarboxylate N-succinyltransferase [Bacteroidales bacterium]
MKEIRKELIEKAWEERSLLQNEEVRLEILRTIELLDDGVIRVAEPSGNEWVVNQWIKKAVILYFPIMKVETSEAGPIEYNDKIPLKGDYAAKGVRVVPGAVARYGSFISQGVILMPSFVNIGA